jgi:hypothetical protein
VALGWATAQGLASSFEASSAELKRPLFWAQVFFYIAVSLLFVSVVIAFTPAVIDLPAFAAPEGVTGFGAMLYMLSSITIRVAILLPGLFLISFTSSRYRTLLHTKDQYIYKKTVASAIPGFKEQAVAKDADPHVKAMTAAAFERLLFNPQEDASRDLERRERGGPLSRWLVKIVREALSEARK